MEYWNVVFVVLGTRNNRAKFWLLRWTGGGIFFEGDVKDSIAILEKDAEEWCFQQVILAIEYIWRFPARHGGTPNSWMIDDGKSPSKMDDLLGVPRHDETETSICHICPISMTWGLGREW